MLSNRALALAAVAALFALTQADLSAAEKKLQLRLKHDRTPTLTIAPKVLHGAAAPDLVIVMVQPEPDPVEGLPNQGYCWKSPQGGPADNVRFAVANAGSATAPQSTVRVDFGDAGVVDTWMPELAPGQMQSWVTPIPDGCYPPTAHGSCHYSIIADAPNGVGESNESNNAVHSLCLLAGT